MALQQPKSSHQKRLVPKELSAFFRNFKVFDFKYIFLLALPIFLQIFVNVIATITASLSFNYYLPTNVNGFVQGSYFAVMSKIMLVFGLVQFIPSLVSTGVLIVASNMIGQGREREISNVIWSGLIVNVVINTLLFIVMYFLSNILLASMSAINDPIIGPGNIILQTNELEFATRYFQYQITWMITYSVAQVFAAALQSIKKNKIAMVGATIGNLFSVAYIYLLLFAFPTVDVIYTSLDFLFGSIIQLLINLVFCIFYIFRHAIDRKFFLKFHPKLALKAIKLGVPICLEYGIYSISQFLVSQAIGSSGLGNTYIELNRVFLNINSFATALITAMGTVTNVLIANEIGKQDKDRAYLLGYNLWKISAYMSLVGSTIILCLTWPLMKLYNIPTFQIDRIGYLIFFLLLIQNFFNTVNLTILRSLWSCNDIYIPILVSAITMLLVQVGLAHLVTDVGYNQGSGAIDADVTFVLVFLVIISDPLLRSAAYLYRWKSGVWRKYAVRL